MKKTILLSCAILGSSVVSYAACPHKQVMESKNTIPDVIYSARGDAKTTLCGKTMYHVWLLNGLYPEAVLVCSESNTFSWNCTQTVSMTAGACYNGGPHKGFGDGCITTVHFIDKITFMFSYKKCLDCNEIVDSRIDENPTHVDSSNNTKNCTSAG